MGGVDGALPEHPDASVYVEALERERHTLERSLTDPHLFSGILGKDWPRTVEELEKQSTGGA